jgi:hypothetical protein
MLMRSPKLSTLSILIVLSFTSRAQIKFSFQNPIQSDLEKVVQDLPNQFKHIRGEEVVNNPQSTDYRSTILLKEAEECVVTKYSSRTKEIYSWRADMLTTDNFETAKKKFRALFSQINNLPVNFNNKAFHFKGQYEQPVEEKSFTSTIFSIDATDEIKNLKIELSMEYELLQWKIKILVYNREREDNERGETKEGL